jgi:hypothetical protein
MSMPLPRAGETTSRSTAASLDESLAARVYARPRRGVEAYPARIVRARMTKTYLPADRTSRDDITYPDFVFRDDYPVDGQFTGRELIISR